MHTTDRAIDRESRRVGAMLLVLAAAMLMSCKSDGPSLTGLSLGSTHYVKVGDVVELRLPIAADGSREWRVTSYDSLYLTVASRPRVVEGPKGRPVLLMTARAKTPGKTEVELTEVVPPGDLPQVKTFKVHISL